MLAKPVEHGDRNGRSNGSHLRTDAIRPPMAIHEPLFIATCDGCGDCIEACETNVLVPDAEGRPRLDFDTAECTFCGSCAESCHTSAFSLAQARDWTVTAHLSGSCLNANEAICRECAQTCEQSAIRFPPRLDGGSCPVIIAEMCNGCGACVSACPADAIVAEAVSEPKI